MTLNPMVLVHDAGLAYAVAVMGVALVAMVGVWPIARARWIHYGRSMSRELSEVEVLRLKRSLATLAGRLQAEREWRKAAEGREADMAEKYARLAAWAARGPEVASEPTERQLHMVRGGK